MIQFPALHQHLKQSEYIRRASLHKEHLEILRTLKSANKIPPNYKI